MLKSAIAGVVVLGSVSFAAAMPAMPTTTGASLPIVKAAVVIKKTVVRHPAVVRRVVPARRVVHSTTVIRR